MMAPPSVGTGLVIIAFIVFVDFFRLLSFHLSS